MLPPPGCRRCQARVIVIAPAPSSPAGERPLRAPDRGSWPRAAGRDMALPICRENRGKIIDREQAADTPFEIGEAQHAAIGMHAGGGPELVAHHVVLMDGVLAAVDAVEAVVIHFVVEEVFLDRVIDGVSDRFFSLDPRRA